MEANYTYYGNHFTIAVSQTFMLYTLDLNSDVWELYISKTGALRVGGGSGKVTATVHWLVSSHSVGFESFPLPLSCCLHIWMLPLWCVAWAR